MYINAELVRKTLPPRKGDKTPHRKKSVYQFGVVGKVVRYVIKPMVLKTFAFVYDNLEEPTIENTWHPNSHTFIEIRDDFKKHNIHNVSDKPDIRGKAYLGMLNLLVAVYEFDLFYRERIDWGVKKVIASDWVTLSDEQTPRPQWWFNDDEVLEDSNGVD